MNQLSSLHFVALVSCVVALKYPPGYPNFGHSYYKKMKTLATWIGGSQMCADIKGTLAVPDSEAELEFLQATYMPSLPTTASLWIGCSDIETEGIYVQQDGEECQYKKWKVGQPGLTTAADQDCLALSQNNGLFVDSPCDKDAIIVCENPAIPSTTCERKDSTHHFTLSCMTNGYVKDLKGKRDLLSAKFCRDDPRCRSLTLAMGKDGQAICQLDSIDGLSQGRNDSCQYLYI